jgi:hypothetical protein
MSLGNRVIGSYVVLGGLLIAALLATPLRAADKGATAGSRFAVAVTYDPAGRRDRSVRGGDSAFCRRRNAEDDFEAIVIIVCFTGAVLDLQGGVGVSPWSPTHGGYRRLVTSLPGPQRFYGGVGVISGLGSAVSWRQVSLINRDYYEIMVAW